MSETTTAAPAEATASTPAQAEAVFGTPEVKVEAAVTPEVKAEAPATPEVKTEAKTEPVVPEKYEFKAPEGVELDPAAVAEFSATAKELGLTQDQAQKLVDYQAKLVSASRETQTQLWTTTREGWVNEAKADKEFGGVQFTENMSFAKKAIDKFGTQALREALDTSAMGDHPEVIRFVYRVGKAMGEDTFTSGSSGGGGQPKSQADRLFTTR